MNGLAVASQIAKAPIQDGPGLQKSLPSPRATPTIWHSLLVEVLHVFGPQNSSPQSMRMRLKIPSHFGHHRLVQVKKFLETKFAFRFRVANRLSSLRVEVSIFVGAKTLPEIFKPLVDVFTPLFGN